MDICKACGTELDEGSIFCHICGSKVMIEEVMPVAAGSNGSRIINAMRSKINMLAVTAAAVILITLAGFFGLAEDPAVNIPPKSVDAKSSDGMGKANAGNSVKGSTINLNDIASLKQNVINKHAEYMNAINSKSATIDDKREAYQAAVFSLDTGLRSYYVDGRKGTDEQAGKELESFLNDLSLGKVAQPLKIAEVAEKASQDKIETTSKTEPAKSAVKPLAPEPIKTVKSVKTPAPAPIKPVKSVKVPEKKVAQAAKPVAVTTIKTAPTTTSTPKPVVTTVNRTPTIESAPKPSTATKTTAQPTLSISDLTSQKQATRDAFSSYMTAVGQGDPSLIQKRAVFYGKLNKLGNNLYTYYVKDGRGSLAQAQKEMRNFLIDLAGSASPLVMQGVNSVR